MFYNKFERNVFLIASSAGRQGHQLQSLPCNESYRSFYTENEVLTETSLYGLTYITDKELCETRGSEAHKYFKSR